MRILVCGGRNYSNFSYVYQVLDSIRDHHGVEVVIHGAAKGADTIAKAWAMDNGVDVIGCPANWKEYGRAAGPIRNAKMLEDHKPDLVVAFPGGRGTDNMCSLAKSRGVEVARYDPLADMANENQKMGLYDDGDNPMID